MPVLLVLLLLAPQATLRDAMSALDRNDFSAAQKSLEAITRQSPRDAGAWLLLAQADARLNQRDAALAAARKAEQFAGADGQVLQGLVNFYANVLPDPPKAATIGERYAAANPTAWLAVATYCLSTNQLERALAAAEKARKAQPFDEQAHFTLVQAYLQKQNFAAAIATIEQARKTFDKSPQLELALGVALYGQRKFPEAADQFLRTIALAPDVPQPYLFLSRMMDHLTPRLAEAIGRFEDFETRHPESYLGYLLHAQAIVLQLPTDGFPPQAEEAARLLEKSLSLQEASPETHYYMGLLLERKRDFPAAAKQFERAVELKPSNAATHFRLARVYDRMGRRGDAAAQRALHEKLSDEK